MIKIDNWSVTTSEWDGYTAPELMKFYLSGEVCGHPLHKDGKRVTTSSIKKIEGRIVTTNSGSVYLLQEPDQTYIGWLIQNNHPLPTEEEPIRLKK